LYLKPLILLLFSVLSSISFSEEPTGNSEIHTLVSPLIAAFKQDDRVFIAQHTRYPLRREKPIAAIENENEFLQRFDQVFDQQLLTKITQSDPAKDWAKLGWRGIMFAHGELWLDSDGKIIAINYQSKAEKKIAQQLIQTEKSQLHASLVKFDQPILQWKTAKFRVRLDQLENGKVRYAVWPKDKSTAEKPDLVLSNGEYIADGSGGNHLYRFSNGQYIYECYVVVIGFQDSPVGYLRVYKNNKLLLDQTVVEEIN
jgi:hypothetical protein